MKTECPEIAVIVPAYNASAHICETIDSILAQSMAAVEIVVVDDGSTDNTADIAASFGPKITVLRQENAGQGSARQRGTNATKANLILFLDADDMLHESALEKLSEALVNNPSVALAYCPVEIWKTGRPIGSQIYLDPTKAYDDKWRAMLNRNFIRTPGCVLIRRSALNEVGGWDVSSRLRGNEDWELWLRLAEHQTFALVGEPLLMYRVHETGFTNSRRKMFRSMIAMFSKHRARWKDDLVRRRAVDDGEWLNFKNIVREFWQQAKSANANRNPSLALSLIGEIAHTGARPTFTYICRMPKRQLLRRLLRPFRTLLGSNAA